MHPKELSINDFTYLLPEERIARYPLEQRDASKLLLYRQGSISDTVFGKLADHLPVDSLLVFNNSKVVEARMLFRKESGGTIEIFALEPHESYPDISSAMQAKGHVLYKCLVGGAGKWKRGVVLQKQLVFADTTVNIEARITERRDDCFVISWNWEPPELSFAEILHIAGRIPIPPYLHRDAEDSDLERYQTVYAKQDGSVAAPTAGLHFTEAVLGQLKAKNIRQAFTTLHVGAGTFMPVKSSTMRAHAMHAEFLEVSARLIQQLVDEETIIPVGTTSLRTIESLYWMGLKCYYDPSITPEDLAISQWEVYDVWLEKAIDKKIALQALLAWMDLHKMETLFSKTEIIIAPGYAFQVAKGLITNFHQPSSTLLLLVAALVGDDWKKIYAYALENDFRFLSYGDSSLLLP
jgi:S-adenosylmethionine:tRNA ribosyltransferase-isomerase